MFDTRPGGGRPSRPVRPHSLAGQELRADVFFRAVDRRPDDPDPELDLRAAVFLPPVDFFLAVVDFLRAGVFFLDVDFLRVVAFFRAFDPDEPVALLDERFLLPDDFCEPSELIADCMRRCDAFRKTEPPPCNALEARYATVPPAAHLAAVLATPAPDASSFTTASVLFWAVDLGVTASFNNFALLVGINHEFSPLSARFTISPRLSTTCFTLAPSGLWFASCAARQIFPAFAG
jgi:hypothetical protein